MRTNIPPAPTTQRGAALIVVLILLLIMTVLGLATLRGAIMEERMSANLYDRSLGFQSAEIALRDAEDQIRNGAAGGAGLAVDCTYGSSASTTNACLPTPANTFSGGAGVAWTNAVDQQESTVSAGSPQYVVQYMGERDSNQELGIPEDPNYGTGGGLTTAEYYRVTARGNDPGSDQGKTRAVTALQATVVRE